MLKLAARREKERKRERGQGHRKSTGGGRETGKRERNCYWRNRNGENEMKKEEKGDGEQKGRLENEANKEADRGRVVLKPKAGRGAVLDHIRSFSNYLSFHYTHTHI